MRRIFAALSINITCLFSALIRADVNKTGGSILNDHKPPKWGSFACRFTNIRKETIEEDFEVLLRGIQPKRETYEVMHAMLKELWVDKRARAASIAKKAMKDLEQLDRKASQVMERLLATSTPALITAYEGEIQKIEEQKLVLSEKPQKTPENLKPFNETYRTALEFLVNPWKLWASDNIQDRRMLLRLAFTGRLPYNRKQGYRTAKTTIPFKALGDLHLGKSGMVQKIGVT